MTHPTIYHELLRPEVHPNGVVPETEELFEEAQALMVGGSETIGTTMMHGCFYLLTNPDVLQRLRIELREAWQDLDQVPTWADLQKLPYLVSILKEKVRLLISTRLQSSRNL